MFDIFGLSNLLDTIGSSVQLLPRPLSFDK